MDRLKRFAKWILAAVLAFIALNVVIIPFYHNAASINLVGAPVDSILQPNSLMITSEEGYGIYRNDGNGFANPSTNLSENGYVLAKGSSQTRANQVFMSDKYTYKLNEKLGGTEESLKVYNIGQDAATFDSIAKNFKSAVEEFPKAKVISIEYCILGIDNNTIAKNFEFDEPVENSLKNYNLTFTDKVKAFIKQYMPFVSYVAENYKFDLSKEFSGAFGISGNEAVEEVIDNDKYEQYVRSALSMMRSVYDGEIIITFLPGMELTEDGVEITEDEQTDILLSLCPEYDIHVLDCRDVFLKAYEEAYVFPTGYWNTHYGPGHLNKKGHEMIADNLYEIIEGLDVEL